MAFFALDFDGVLCDSAEENAASAWKCAHELWPDICKDERVPVEVTQRFLEVRPYLETGFQAVLMIRMILENQPLAAFRDELSQHCQRLLQKSGLDSETMIRKFGACRDHWIRHDLEGWLQSHRFYPGTMSALQKALQFHEVVILTTKQERFVQLLLDGQGIAFPRENIWGLDRKISKEQLLEQFHSQGKNEIAFVEDRLETLQKVSERAKLGSVKLFYALWGYGTEKERQLARNTPRLTCLELDAFKALLSNNNRA